MNITRVNRFLLINESLETINDVKVSTVLKKPAISEDSIKKT